MFGFFDTMSFAVLATNLILSYFVQVGVLWTSLADFYIRSGNLQRARDIYAEAISTVITVRDFSQTFDAYAEFEQRITKARMEALEKSTNVTETGRKTPYIPEFIVCR